MLRVYRDKTGSFSTSTAHDLPGEIIWIDLLNPTEAEKQFVGQRAGVHVPSTEALSEIEASSRLFVENDVIYLSTPVVANADTVDAFVSPVGLILTKNVLVTIRFAELKALKAAMRFDPAPDSRGFVPITPILGRGLCGSVSWGTLMVA